MASYAKANMSMGGDYSITYKYDWFNRLKTTTASFSPAADGGTPPAPIAYSLNMEYDNAGGITKKTQNALGFDTKLDYNFAYTFKSANPHQLDVITNSVNHSGGLPEQTRFTYNASGSMQKIEQKPFNSSTYTTTENYVHNEEQLLMGYHNVADNKYAHFVYDHTGNRILKGGMTNAIASTNGQATQQSFVVDPYTIYANAYYVEQPYSTVSTISKHYYMGMQRIATDIGLAGQTPGEDPGEGPMKNETQNNPPTAVTNNLVSVLQSFGAQEGKDFTRQDLTKTPNFTDYYPQDSSASMTMKNGSNTNSSTTQFGEGGGGGPTPPASRLLYYYHPDYLGNVEYITDASGLPYQYFFYSPWGEGLVDQKANTGNWESPYQFNGKEVDSETGLYYYGARYYNPQVSVWLGVDAMASRGPDITPYAFIHNNPVMLVDPDGNWPINSMNPRENQIDEPPINFFKKDEIGMNKMFDFANRPENYTIGDRKFTVYGHGNYGLISDRKALKGSPILNGAQALDEQLKARSTRFKEVTSNKEDFTLVIASCLSGAKVEDDQMSLAEEFSRIYPNSTIVGFDGYGRIATVEGERKIIGISTLGNPGPFNNSGKVVIFKNGEEIKRISFDEFLKLDIW